MADGVLLNPGTGGKTVASDEIAGFDYQRIKLIHGADGVNDGDVAAANPLPIKVMANSLVSTVNSSTANLAGAAVFTGTSEDVSEYSTVMVSVFSSHASATDGLSMQQSSDGTNWDLADVYSIPAATGKTFNVPVQAKFFRLVYTNGATLTTSLRIQTLYSKAAKRSSSIRPQDARTNDNDFEELVAMLAGYNGTGWDRLRSTIANGLVVDVSRTVDGSASGNITAASQSVTLALNGGGGVAAQISGTWVGTLQFEGTIDGTTWYPVNAVRAGSSNIPQTTTVNGLHRMTPAGLAQVRVTATAWTSGTATINIRASAGTGGTFANQILPVTDGTEVNASFRGRSQTFRTPGRAGTAGQKIFALHNATGSTKIVTINQLTVDLVQTVVKAVTVLPPVIRIHRFTALPTNGNAGSKTAKDSALTTNASITVWQDASADGTSSASALTITIPANSLLSQEFAPRMITAAGYEMADRIEMVVEQGIVLRTLEGVVVFLDYTLATQNPVTDMWIVGCDWYEV